MSIVMCEVVRARKREQIKAASCISMSFDDRKGYKLIKILYDVPLHPRGGSLRARPSDEPSQIPWAAAQAASQGAVQASTRDAASIAQAPSQGTAASPAPRRQDDHELLICSWNLGVPNLVPENCLNCMSEKAEFSDLVATQIQERVAWNVDVLLLQEVTEFWARHFQTVFSLSTEGDVNLQLHWCEKNAILAKDFWRG